ncbi:zinc finger BED domain-containing protein RICESLEEPER 1-like [Mercurialis annua]|uniref:zinc finger BED domain-containing protein RICESLEEPER 1-like n=1 Tax=Mercurialis annua TaxID=3986 RepID=UPI00215FFE74|nr:zinc finger BED domain-containing protein RICESLEEPER 1-like [Mercurialis annua]XP_050228659.1 zinc finger BED domain-containing protein RICESLEEPER 1-like [Mercurialis annua]
MITKDFNAMDLSDAVIVKSSRLKSVVWNDFDRVKKGDTFVAICRHCNKKLSGSSTSGTSHLRNHLIRCQRRTSHGGIAQIYSKKKDGNLALSNVSIGQESGRDEPLIVVNYNFDQGPVNDDGVTIACGSSGSFDYRRSRKDLARMIILHGYSIRMVDHVGFRVFVRNLQPMFELATAERVEADCLDIYKQEKEKVYAVLDKLHGNISVSACLWSASNDAEYLCLTAHYIDDVWQLNKKVLVFLLVDPMHTDDMYPEVIMSSLMDWDIDRKLFSVTFDSHSSSDDVVDTIRIRLSQNRSLFCDGMLFDIRCAASLVNFMVHDALEALFEVTHKIRESIRYIRSSQETQMKFNEIVVQAEVESQKCLCLDNLLRWDSTYFMLEAALDYRSAFSVLQERDPAYAMCPTDIEWERARSITRYLKHFVEVTNVFVKNKYPTANMYFSEICDIHLQLIEWCKNPDDYIRSTAVNMKNRFDEYWDKCSFALAVAAMLDPRFKLKLIEYYYKRIFGTGSAELIDEVFECIKRLYNDHSNGSPLASFDQDSSGCLLICDRDRLTGYDQFLHETSETQGEKSDLDKFLEEPLFPRSIDFNILNWWKVHTPRYPILAMMARNILGIPMSKVTPEFAFNSGRRVLDREWSSLQPTTVQALMCSQDWMSVSEN